MFKFNFSNDEEDSQSGGCDNQNTDQWYKSREVSVPSNILEVVTGISRDQIVKINYNCPVSYYCVSAKEVMHMLKENSDNENFLDVLAADRENSDLIPGRYEGGLKVWECTKDLAFYLLSRFKGAHEDLNEKRVLDLGCGCGILGIMCLQEGAYVTFQDYNKEVLEAMTIPNIFLNCNDSVRNRIKLYSGDWLSFLQLVTPQSEGEGINSTKYDYILTSETIYNPQNYRKIIKVIQKLLKPRGSAFVAAKAHYFGVGGNLKAFETLARQEGLLCFCCWETTEGVSRGILEIKLSLECLKCGSHQPLKN